MLRLHTHQHTEDAPGLVLAAQTGTKAVVSSLHQHCYVDSFCHTPFQVPGPVVVPPCYQLPVYAEYRSPGPICRASHLLEGACLRGPPPARA